MPDEFASESSPDAYSPSKYYVTSTDKRGHHVTCQVTMQPEVDGAVCAMIAAKTHPMYRTKQDFYRDSVVHRLNQIQTADTPLSPEMERLRDQLMVQARQESVIRMRETEKATYDGAIHLARETRDNDEKLAILQDALSVLSNEEYKQDLQRSIDYFS